MTSRPTKILKRDICLLIIHVLPERSEKFAFHVTFAEEKAFQNKGNISRQALFSH